MPSDLEQIAQQQQMTHDPDRPNPASPYLDWLRQQARRTFVEPLRSTGFIPGDQNWGRGAVTGMQDFSQSGLTGVAPSLRSVMPGAANTLGDLVQSPAARNVFSSANIGGLPLIEAMWQPWELQFLKKMYPANIDPYTLQGLIKKYFPNRSMQSIQRKALELGLKRPVIPPYVRQPGSPSLANDPQRAAQIAELLKKGMSSTEISSKMGDVSARTIRRYINENLNRPRMAGRGGSSLPPSMPSFKFQDEVVTGDPEYEKALMQYLQQRYPQ